MNNKPLYLIAVILILLVRTQTDHMVSSVDKVTINAVLFFITIGLCFLTYKEFVAKKDD